MAKAKTPTTGSKAGRTGGAARTPAVAAVSATADAPKKRVSPAQFAREVRGEAKKITWTSWKETWITSVMVFIMVVVTALFLRVVDIGLGAMIQQLLKLAS